MPSLAFVFPTLDPAARHTLTWKGQSTELLALIGSGADESFLNAVVVGQLDLAMENLNQPIEANALDG